MRSEYLSLVRPSEVWSEVVEHHGMLSFLTMLGACARRGRARVALSYLEGVGLDRATAWSLVDGWDDLASCESLSAWSPELVVAAAIIRDVAGWRSLPWSSLSVDICSQRPFTGESRKNPPRGTGTDSK